MSETIDHLIAELQRESHDRVYRLLLEHGTRFEAAEPPAGLPDPEPNSCYFNAYEIATGQPDRFTYYEGVGVTWYYDGIEATELSLSGVIPHGWCVDRAGRVVDTSWRATTSERPAAYCGLPLPLDIVQPFACVRSRGTFSELYPDFDELESRLGIAR